MDECSEYQQSDCSSEEPDSEQDDNLPLDRTQVQGVDRCVILYDKQNQCIFEDKPQSQSQTNSRLASLRLSRPAFVVRSLREVLEPGELSPAWRSSKGKEASFSCYNRSVLIGVKRLQLGGVTARSEDVRLYPVGEDPASLASRQESVGYEAYFTRADFEDEDDDRRELAKAAAAEKASSSSHRRREHPPLNSTARSKWN